MARFDLPRRRDEPGHLPIVQSHLHDHPSTRIVVPPIPADAAPRPARGLDPALEIEADRRILSPQDMAAIPRPDLGRPVGHLGHEQDTMTRALDILFTGFRRQPAITRARRAPRAERTGGDLRIAHFLGIRAMQALPAPAPLGAGRAVIALAGAGWVGLTPAAWAAARAGIPLMP